MSRRKNFKPIKVQPDVLYKNRLVTKLVNRSMRDGKKTVIQKEVYQAFDLIKKNDQDPLKIFLDAVNNVKPNMEVRSRRIGGAAYQIPVVVRGIRKESLAIRWIIAATRSRSSSEYKTYAVKLAAELMDAAKGEGLAVKKKLEIEKIAEANKAFSHFKW